MLVQTEARRELKCAAGSVLVSDFAQERKLLRPKVHL